jgi:hypothetical protein
MAPQKPLSPEAVEAARRGYNAGLRALAYGSVLGLGVVRTSESHDVVALLISRRISPQNEAWQRANFVRTRLCFTLLLCHGGSIELRSKCTAYDPNTLVDVDCSLLSQAEPLPCDKHLRVAL